MSTSLGRPPERRSDRLPDVAREECDRRVAFFLRRLLGEDNTVPLQAPAKTLAGLGTPDKPHPIQKAYVEEQVPQCGYCINGWIMTAAAFLNQAKKPTDAQIREALTGLKCRCGTHMGILRAVKRAAAMMG